jgi:hypothetical protein
MTLGARSANRTPGTEIDGELSANLTLRLLPACSSSSQNHDCVTILPEKKFLLYGGQIPHLSPDSPERIVLDGYD